MFRRSPENDTAVGSQRSNQIVLMLASLPPPVVGATLVTKTVSSKLLRQGEVRIYDWMPSSTMPKWCQQMLKSFRVFLALFWIAGWKLRGKPIVLYTVANGGPGMLLNILTIAVSRALKIRTVLHHHTAMYLQSRDWRMTWIDRLLGPDGVHVVLGPEMKDGLRELYDTELGIVVLPNGFMVDDVKDDQAVSLRDCSEVLHLGHISNLRISKGLDRVFDIFEKLLSMGCDVRLTLAGPLAEVGARRLLDSMQRTHGERIEYLGPVYDEEKDAFYRNIDVLLHPTRDDAQPLVVLEAMSYSKPVFATDVGAVGSMVADREWLIQQKPDYDCARALELILRMAEDAEFYRKASMAARHSSQLMRQHSVAALESFAEWMYSNSPVPDTLSNGWLEQTYALEPALMGVPF